MSKIILVPRVGRSLFFSLAAALSLSSNSLLKSRFQTFSGASWVVCLYFVFVWEGRSLLEYCFDSWLKSPSPFPLPPLAGSKVGRAAVVIFYALKKNSAKLFSIWQTLILKSINLYPSLWNNFLSSFPQTSVTPGNPPSLSFCHLWNGDIPQKVIKSGDLTHQNPCKIQYSHVWVLNISTQPHATRLLTLISTKPHTAKQANNYKSKDILKKKKNHQQSYWVF